MLGQQVLQEYGLYNVLLHLQTGLDIHLERWRQLNRALSSRPYRKGRHQIRSFHRTSRQLSRGYVRYRLEPKRLCPRFGRRLSPQGNQSAF